MEQVGHTCQAIPSFKVGQAIPENSRVVLCVHTRVRKRENMSLF